MPPGHRSDPAAWPDKERDAANLAAARAAAAPRAADGTGRVGGAAARRSVGKVGPGATAGSTRHGGRESGGLAQELVVQSLWWDIFLNVIGYGIRVI